MRRIFTLLLVAFFVLSFTAVTFAAGSQTVNTKLQRGSKNLVLGWTEIPKNIVSTTKKDGAIVGLTIGTIKGFFNAFARTLSGAVDVATFPAGGSERPSIKPSMVPETTATK